MNIGIQFEFGRTSGTLPDVRGTHPVMVFTISRGLLGKRTGQDVVITEYREWIRKELEECERKKLYALIQIPLQYLGAAQVNDARIGQFLYCRDENRFRSRIMALHLTQGNLTDWDYYLRIYYLRRMGLTYEMVVDDGERTTAKGFYRDWVEHRSLAIWGKGIRPVETVRQAYWTWFLDEWRKERRLLFLVNDRTYYEEEDKWKRLNRWLSLRSGRGRFSRN